MKKQLFSLSAIIISAVIVLTGCGAAELAKDSDWVKVEEPEYNYYGFGDYNISNQKYSGTTDDFSTGYTYTQSEELSDLVEVETDSGRKIIYTSSYTIQTTEFEQTLALLDALCEKYGAYYEQSETYGTKENANRNGDFTVRVPVENYDAFKSEAGSIGVVTRSSENNQDVTEVYIDTEARLESATIREERLLTLLENADSLDDILLLEKELADVRYEIESMSGSLRKYDSLISYSTIEISVNEVIEEIEIKPVPKTFSEKVSGSLSDGYDNFTENAGNCLLIILYNLPGIIISLVTILIICIILKIVLKRIKKKNEKKAEIVNTTESEENNNTETK